MYLLKNQEICGLTSAGKLYSILSYEDLWMKNYIPSFSDGLDYNDFYSYNR